MQKVDELWHSVLYISKKHHRSCPASDGKSITCICKPTILISNDADFYLKACALLRMSPKRRSVGKAQK